jgi:hypothetical protein
MRSRGLLVLVGVLALASIPWDDVQGGRGRGGGGRGGGSGRGGGRGGMPGGGYRGGPSVNPYGSGGHGAHSRGTVVGPGGGARATGSASGSHTTKRGTTIDYAGAGKTATGPGGATAGAGVGGVKVTTPGGRTAAKAGAAGGVKGPGGAGAVKGGSVGAASGPRGSAAGASRGGAAVGPGGAAAGGTRVGTATGPGGRTVSGAARGRAATNPYGSYRSAARGVAVAGAAGHFTAYRRATAVRTQGAAIRTGFAGYHYFGTGWYASHPGAWRAFGWGARRYWRWASYAAIAGFCSYPEEPVVYDYGSTVVYEGDTVYYNGESVATAEEYTKEASNIAAVGQEAMPPEKEEWQSLGVFALVQDEEKEANNIFQIAINKDGVLRGNYHNGLTDTTLPIYGSVDKKTQRAAWTVGDKKDTVYETGMGNLAEPETSVLVHKGKDRTRQWMLVRLDPPKEKEKE